MTNAEFYAANMAATIAEVTAAARAWWEAVGWAKQWPDATAADIMAAWLRAEHAGGEAPETTIVTTLTVTHIMHGPVNAEQAQWLAEGARAALRAGYRGKALPPDDVCVNGVQLFSFDGDDGEEAQA